MPRVAGSHLRPLAPGPWRLPREHGFWVMLSVMTLSLVARNPGATAVLTALVVATVAVVVAMGTRRLVRQSSSFRFAAVLGLAAAGFPVELVGGRSVSAALLDSLAWASVFGAFALGVGACTARSSRTRRAHVRPLTLLSVLVPAAVSVAFALAHLSVHALASALAALSSTVLAIWAPGSKRMKSIGLSLAVCAAIEAVVLAFA